MNVKFGSVSVRPQAYLQLFTVRVIIVPLLTALNITTVGIIIVPLRSSEYRMGPIVILRLPAILVPALSVVALVERGVLLVLWDEKTGILRGTRERGFFTRERGSFTRERFTELRRLLVEPSLFLGEPQGPLRRRVREAPSRVDDARGDDGSLLFFRFLFARV